MTTVEILVSASNFENPHFIAGFITYSTQNLMAVKNFHLFCGLVIDAVKAVPGNSVAALAWVPCVPWYP